MNVCVVGAAAALEIERSLRAEIEERVLELLAEVRGLRNGEGFQPQSRDRLVPFGSLHKTERKDLGCADDTFRRTADERLEKSKPSIWQTPSEINSQYPSIPPENKEKKAAAGVESKKSQVCRRCLFCLQSNQLLKVKTAPKS